MTLKKKNIFSFIFIFLIFLTCVPKAHAATPLELVQKYKSALTTGKKVTILIVPGHDDDYWGTEFKDVREADVVVAIGQYLFDYLKKDSRITVQISRTQKGYTDVFKNYFINNRDAIQSFITTSKTTLNAMISSGDLKPTTSVPHNNAQPEVALRLYGINKWANENNIDITIHLHINDQGGRVWGKVGDYTGFAVYIPQEQFGNAKTSDVFGEALYNELLLKNHKSTYPPESAGLIEDQDLIAVGAGNTAKSAVALIEYGYIYEPQYQDLSIQERVAKDLAYQTYLGIHRFFGDRALYVKTIKSTDISAIQSALTNEGVYACKITGVFGPCTEKGVKTFQKKYGIPQTGQVGPRTLAKFNSLE